MTNQRPRNYLTQTQKTHKEVVQPHQDLPHPPPKKTISSSPPPSWTGLSPTIQKNVISQYLYNIFTNKITIPFMDSDLVSYKYQYQIPIFLLVLLNGLSSFLVSVEHYCTKASMTVHFSSINQLFISQSCHKTLVYTGFW